MILIISKSLHYPLIIVSLLRIRGTWVMRTSVISLGYKSLGILIQLILISTNTLLNYLLWVALHIPNALELPCVVVLRFLNLIANFCIMFMSLGALLKLFNIVFFTGPDIAFHVNKLCMFLQALIDAHWDALKCVLHYLKLLLIMDFSCPSLPPIS